MIVKATIEAIETDVVTLKFTDGQLLRVPTEAIHGTASIGAQITLLLSTGIADQPNTQDLARALLNELILPQ
jgi:hypothetical protein